VMVVYVLFDRSSDRLPTVVPGSMLFNSSPTIYRAMGPKSQFDFSLDMLPIDITDCTVFSQLTSLFGR